MMLLFCAPVWRLMVIQSTRYTHSTVYCEGDCMQAWGHPSTLDEEQAVHAGLLATDVHYVRDERRRNNDDNSSGATLAQQPGLLW